jgi:hypothetical protein
MDSARVIAFPRPGADVTAAGSDDAGTIALAEIDAAIALVAAHVARRVRLTALPFVERVAAIGLAHATAAGLGFRFERPDRIGVATVTVEALDGPSLLDDC